MKDINKQIEELCKYFELSIKSLNNIYNRALELNLENDQRFLDWLDTINEISVRK